jgi:protein-S-isoprenylcysteine O-methyltransferase Ste14
MSRASGRTLLGVRAAFFLLLMPGTVVGYVPYRILQATGRLAAPPGDLATLAASVLFFGGIAALLRCVWDFFSAGRGTLAPVDPPVTLVVEGLYRYTRNPMYNALLAILLGEAGLFRSPALALYAAGGLAACHLFVVLYEERTLEARFGPDYRAYRKSVPRWGFTRRAYEPPGEGTT